MSESTNVIVNADNQIVGRLSSAVAKMLLEGKSVTIVNAEKAIISGNKDSILSEVQEFRGVKSAVNPKNTPRHFIRPDRLMRDIIRGMLPYRKPRGRQALKRLRVYVGRPEGVTGEPIDVKDMSASRLTHKYVRLQEVSQRFGSG